MKERRRLTKVELNDILHRYKRGEPVARIAKIHGINPTYPSILAGRHGLKRRVRRRLTKAELNDILHRYERGELVACIANVYGIDPTYPSILAGRHGLKRRRSDDARATMSIMARRLY